MSKSIQNHQIECNMRNNIRFFLVVVMLGILGVVSSSAKNRALLIGISEYCHDYKWNTISGTNDIELIKGVLVDFSIRELKDKDATYDNIIKEFERLIKQSKPSDVVYIHFSGHGQPVEDYDGDEEDGWDEAFVPYDAGDKYVPGVYEGNKHLLDDTLNTLLDRLRQKLGPEGYVYVVVDACHAGEQFRGEEDDVPVRGSIYGISKNNKHYVPQLNTIKHYPISPESNKSNIVMMEACRSYQVNREIKRDGAFYGPLSYSVYLVLKNMTIHSNPKWFLNVEDTFNKQRPAGSSQRMVTESTVE